MARWCWVSPDVPLDCGSNGWIWPGVAFYLCLLLPVWLPGISLAGLMFEGLRPKAGLRASQASGPIRLSRTVLWRGLRRLGEVPVAASAARA